jgi:hypothetical protein
MALAPFGLKPLEVATVWVFIDKFWVGVSELLNYPLPHAVSL